MSNSLSSRLRRILPLRTIVRVLAARAGAAAARLRPIQERVYIAANRDGELRGNLAEIQRALTGLNPTPSILCETGSESERRGGLPILGLVSAVARIFLRSYRVASSRLVIVDDYFFPIYPVKKRPGVTIVQVWHACGAFKRFGRATLEAEWGADQIFLEWVPIHANYDLTLVSSASIAPIYAEAFGQPVETISAAFGIPRTDALLPSPRRDAAERAVRERLALRDGRTTILYAPTFRGADLKGAASPELLDIAALHRALGSEYRLIVRLHPFVESAMRIPPEVGDFVVDASAEPDVNEVMLAGDILVSDYSSIIFEYALLNRPMAFLAPDLAAYERERGFFFGYRQNYDGVCLLANDILLPQNWLSNWVMFAKRVSKTGIIGIHCVEELPPLVDGVHKTHTPFGDNFITRELIDAIGGYNEAYDPYGMQDRDFAERATIAGFTNYYLPDLKSEHIGHDVGNGTEYRAMKDASLQNAQAVWEKYQPIYHEEKKLRCEF